MTFPPIENSDHAVVSVFIDFPSYSNWYALSHCIAYDYSCADCDGFHDHLIDVPCEDVFKLSASAAASEFCEWVQVGVDAYVYISLIENIMSSFTHLHGFQLLVLLP